MSYYYNDVEYDNEGEDDNDSDDDENEDENEGKGENEDNLQYILYTKLYWFIKRSSNINSNKRLLLLV